MCAFATSKRDPDKWNEIVASKTVAQVAPNLLSTKKLLLQQKRQLSSLILWHQIKAPTHTRMSRQAAFRSVIWSAMVSPVKPGTRLANSTILIMHLVASSLNLSHRPRSSLTRWSALEFCNTHMQTHTNREWGIRRLLSMHRLLLMISSVHPLHSALYVSHLSTVNRLHKTWALKTQAGLLSWICWEELGGWALR